MQNNISLCISFIVAILGIAYPILLGVVSGLDEKYSSQVVIDLFNKEKIKRNFVRALVCSLFASLIWIIKFPPVLKLRGFNYFITNSANLILLCSTAFLIVVFLLLINKILLFYSPRNFLPYLINKHKKSNNNNYEYLRGIADILYFSIRNQNETIAKTISSFLYDEFKSFRIDNANVPIIYPTVFYELINKTIEELASQKNNKLIFLEHRSAGEIWLLGEFGTFKISEQTYDFIWMNLNLALKYGKDNFIIFHWEQSHQYIKFNLGHIFNKYGEDYATITNEKEVTERNEERNRFLELNYALGGLLLYKKKYKCIKSMFSYTQSIPPTYELLPNFLNEVFRLFFQFLDAYEIKYPFMSSKYYFPGLRGLNADGAIKNWICKYIALLFIRQYSINPSYGMRPLTLPSIPTSQTEKQLWIENLDYFKMLIQEVLKNEKLLKETKLMLVTDDWCQANGYPTPIELIENVKQTAIKSFEMTLIEQPISAVKVQQFKDTTISIIRPTLETYRLLGNKENLSGELNKWYVKSELQIIDKSAFSDNQEFSHLNFDSILAEGFIEKYKSVISEVFAFAASQRFLLNSEDIIEAIKNLNINDEYIIVSFGIDFENLKSKFVGITDALNKIKVIKLDFRNVAVVGESLFVLKESDLPRLVYNEIKEKDVEVYFPEKVIDEFNVYLNVIDLNASPNVKNELEKSSGGKDLGKSVLIGIFMNLEIQWRKNVQCIQIKQASFFRENGINNKLSDIKPIIDITKKIEE